MEKLNQSMINISDGKLRLNKSNTKGSLKEQHIQNAIFNYTQDSVKSLELTKYILNCREGVNRVNLKRKILSKKKI